MNECFWIFMCSRFHFRFVFYVISWYSLLSASIFCLFILYLKLWCTHDYEYETRTPDNAIKTNFFLFWKSIHCCSYYLVSTRQHLWVSNVEKCIKWKLFPVVFHSFLSALLFLYTFFHPQPQLTIFFFYSLPLWLEKNYFNARAGVLFKKTKRVKRVRLLLAVLFFPRN